MKTEIWAGVGVFVTMFVGVALFGAGLYSLITGLGGNTDVMDGILQVKHLEAEAWAKIVSIPEMIVGVGLFVAGLIGAVGS